MFWVATSLRALSIALLIVFALSFGCTPGRAGDADNGIARASIDFELGKRSLYRSIKRDFPDDYESIANAFHGAALKSNDADVIADVVANVMIDIRRRRSDLVRRASSITLRTLSKGMAEFHRDLQRTEGNAFCAAYARDGASAFEAAGKPNTHRETIDGQLALLWELFKEGQEKPTERSTPTNSDWIAVATEMLNRGAQEASFDVVFEERYDDPEYCSAFVIFLDALAATRGDPGDRVRADFLAEYARS